jgi:hypothetical protein
MKIPEWSLMVNWANIQNEVESVIGLVPDQASIEEAIAMLENDFNSDQIYAMEAEELEQALTNRILKIMRKTRAKDIRVAKKQQKEQKETKETSPFGDVDVKILGPFGQGGSLKDLKEMGLDVDPEMMKNITDSIFKNMFGSKPKKKKSDDDDTPEDDDPGASFYM